MTWPAMGTLPGLEEQPGSPAEQILSEFLEDPFLGHRPRVPRVYLAWANPVFLPFFPFNRISNLRVFSVAFSSTPTPGTNAANVTQFRGCC